MEGIRTMKKIKVPVGWALYYTMKLFIGDGHKDISDKRRVELFQEFIKSFNSLGEVKVNEESYDLVKERL